MPEHQIKMKSTSLTILGCLIFLSTFAQRSDSTRTAINGFNRSGNGPRPYREVITEKARTDEGLFKVHKVEEKWYFEIPDSLLGRDIMRNYFTVLNC